MADTQATPFAVGDEVDYYQFVTIHKCRQPGICTKNKVAYSIRFEVSPDAPYQDKWLEVGKKLSYVGQGRNGDQLENSFNRGMIEAYSRNQPVHVFEFLTNGLFKYWGFWKITDYTYQSEQIGGVKTLVYRFILEPDNQ